MPNTDDQQPQAIIPDAASAEAAQAIAADTEQSPLPGLEDVAGAPTNPAQADLVAAIAFLHDIRDADVTLPEAKRHAQVLIEHLTSPVMQFAQIPEDAMAHIVGSFQKLSGALAENERLRTLLHYQEHPQAAINELEFAQTRLQVMARMLTLATAFRIGKYGVEARKGPEGADAYWWAITDGFGSALRPDGQWMTEVKGSNRTDETRRLFYYPTLEQAIEAAGNAQLPGGPDPDEAPALTVLLGGQEG
jgi:hypothetical protein